LRRSLEPQPKVMLRPVCWSEQNNAGTLHEERAQRAGRGNLDRTISGISA
jgi:hypothetical protein